MTMRRAETIPFGEDAITGVVPIHTGATVSVELATALGYDFTRAALAAFVGVLEASVCGDVWTTVANLAASGQGAIADHYQYVRINITGDGAVGATTRLVVRGKVL
jgi:hypothetical protein